MKSTAVLNIDFGARERSLALSAKTSLFASPGDTMFLGKINWDHIGDVYSLAIARVLSTPVFDYGLFIGYRF
ncbi:MAG: hypothetical protein ACOYM2_07695 [Rectinemataceae bacterium]